MILKLLTKLIQRKSNKNWLRRYHLDRYCEKISKKKKPVLLATGASNFQDVKRAVKEILKFNKKIVIMQCRSTLEKLKTLNM